MKKYPASLPQTIKTPFTFMVPVFVSLFFMLTVSPVLAVDDDYLRALEGEASGSTADTTKGSDDYLSTLSAEAEASAHVADSTNKIIPDEEQLALEEFLQNKKPTTYKYYKKLNAEDKIKIVDYYHNDHTDKATRVGHLRKKILDLYFKR